MQHKPNKLKLDRFGTLREILKHAATIKKHKVKGVAGGYAAVLAAVALWSAADARNGRVVMPVTRLAATIGSNRVTARRAMAVLRELNLIRPYTRKDGTEVRGQWLVRHTERPVEAG